MQAPAVIRASVVDQHDLEIDHHRFEDALEALDEPGQDGRTVVHGDDD